MTEEYRTIYDVIKEIATHYIQLGKKLDELNRMIQKGKKK